MKLAATGRLGTDGVYLKGRGGPFLIVPPWRTLLLVAGHPRSPFVKWGYEELESPVTGDSDHLETLCEQAILTSVKRNGE